MAWVGVAATASPAVAQRSLLRVLASVALAGAAGVYALFPERPRAGVSPRRFRERFGRLQASDLGAGRAIRLLPFGPGRVYWSLRRFDLATLRDELAGSPGTFLAGTALFTAGSAVFWGPMPAYLDARGLSTTAIFGVFLVGNLGSAVSYGRVAALEARLGAVRVQLGGIGARVLLFPGTVVVAGGVVPFLAVAFALIGVSWALVAVTGPLLVSQFVPAAERPAALASYTAVATAGTGVGSVVGGAAANATGYLLAYSLAGGLVLAGVLLAWRGLAGPGDFPAPGATAES